MLEHEKKNEEMIKALKQQQEDSQDYSKSRQQSLSELKNELKEHEKPQLPTVGRIIHYYHGEDKYTNGHNGIEFYPAIVVQTWGSLIANICVFKLDGAIVRWSINHKSEISSLEYWEWPPKA